MSKHDDGAASPGQYRSHLTAQLQDGIRRSPDTEVCADRGLFYCLRCKRRVTVNNENGNEYGHTRDCLHHEFSDLDLPGRSGGEQ